MAKLVERLMRRPRKKYGKSAMRLLEQSVHLLRLAPLELLPVYYIGSLPFMLGLLYFWSDMSRSADAADHVHAASLAMALLFVWMKTWQAIFSARVMSRLGRQPPFLWSLSRLATIAATQSLIQASGFVVLPLALLMTIPFGWCTAFYQNVTVLGAIESDGVRRLCREAYHHAGRWPYQNHKILAVMFLFAMVVFVNLATALYLLPYGVKSVFGIETIFTLHRFSLLNTTFILTVVSLTYLFVDPIVKTVYALRCFDGFAMASGDDIRTELKNIVAGKQAITLVFIGILLSVPAVGCGAASAEETTMPPRESRNTVSAQMLDRSIQRVLKRSEFSWRLPRSRVQSKKARPSWLETAVKTTAKQIAGAFETVWKWIKRFGRWIRGLFGSEEPPSRKFSGEGNWMNPVRGFIVLLAVLFLGIGGVVLWKSWQRRTLPIPVAAATGAAPADVDLDDESLRADELPSERWVALAVDLLQGGQLRPALRAYFLASLAQLSEQRMITIQRYKSNRDYVRELGRRAHTRTDLIERFASQVKGFDRVWYGMHPVTDAEVKRHATMQQGLRHHAENV